MRWIIRCCHELHCYHRCVILCGLIRSSWTDASHRTYVPPQKCFARWNRRYEFHAFCLSRSSATRIGSPHCFDVERCNVTTAVVRMGVCSQWFPLCIGKVFQSRFALRLYVTCLLTVVTPSLREDIVKICNRRRVLCAPGCGSLTEINRAEELGCDVVKLFPASVYGPKFIKAVKGPQPWTCIMPTGGVQTDKESLKSWIDAGSFCVGLGSQLIDSHSVNSRDYRGIKEKVAQTLKTIRELQ